MLLAKSALSLKERLELIRGWVFIRSEVQQNFLHKSKGKHLRIQNLKKIPLKLNFEWHRKYKDVQQTTMQYFWLHSYSVRI